MLDSYLSCYVTCLCRREKEKKEKEEKQKSQTQKAQKEKVTRLFVLNSHYGPLKLWLEKEKMPVTCSSPSL